jgi:uroporphyrinogen-III synthase
MPGITTFLITRPEKDSKKLSAILKNDGYHVLIEPLLSIEPLTLNHKTLLQHLALGPQAVIVTSRYSVEALAEITPLRDFPLIAVGVATADSALKRGLINVSKAKGTAIGLSHFIAENYAPENGPLLYACGTDMSTDMASILARQNFSVSTVPIYSAKVAKAFSDSLSKNLKEGRINSVLFFSKRTAATYIKLCLSDPIREAHHTMKAFCLSQAIADKITSLKWNSIHIAEEPTVDGMLTTIKDVFGK